jgi:hypothetical protein
MDLMETLKRIESRAANAARDIQAGRDAGLPVTGISALREISLTARDLMTDLQTTAGATKGARATTTPSSREGRA